MSPVVTRSRVVRRTQEDLGIGSEASVRDRSVADRIVFVDRRTTRRLAQTSRLDHSIEGFCRLFVSDVRVSRFAVCGL
jgi:hypothetical protein